MALNKPCPDVVKEKDEKLHKYLVGKAGEFDGSEKSKEAWKNAARDLQEHSLNTINDIFAQLGVKHVNGNEYKKIEPKQKAEPVPNTGKGEPVQNDALKDVESTTKALEKIKPTELNDLARKSGTIYHGSPNKVAEFNPDNSTMDYGHFYTTNPETAKGYMGGKDGYLHILNLKGDKEGFLNYEAKASKVDLKKLGLDENLDLTGEEALIKAHEESNPNDLGMGMLLEEKGFKGDYQPSQEQGTVFNPKDIEVVKSGKYEKIVPESISEAYHKSKADGTNPELVKAVEEALAPKENKTGNEVNPAQENKSTKPAVIETVHNCLAEKGLL